MSPEAGMSIRNFPKVHATLRLEDGDDLFGVEFYPFDSQEANPPFAFAYDRSTVICRPSSDPEEGIEVIRVFQDEDVNASLWSVAWSVDMRTKDPLICVTGEPAKIKILNIQSGLQKTLIGHGARINSILTSPVDPYILASASDDHTVRIWNLMEEYDKDPCRVMLAGWGHKAEVLSMNFHQTGRYLITAGNDTRICLWTIPDISTTSKDPPSSKTTIVHYPHFVTEEIHPYLVDCVAFHGDLILSKCLTRKGSTPSILLWRIVGFSSSKASPPMSSVPTGSSVTHETRSAFCSSSNQGPEAFQVLLSFSMPNVQHYCHSFGLYSRPNEHPVLAMGDSNHWMAFWDLELIERGLLGTAELKPPRKVSEKPERTDGNRVATYPQAATGVQVNIGSGVQEQGFEGPFNPLKPHKAMRIPPNLFKFGDKRIVRAFSWSRQGEWCVAVGDDGLICLMRCSQKEKKDKASKPANRPWYAM